MRLMELYGNDFSAEIIHEYYASLKVRSGLQRGTEKRLSKWLLFMIQLGIVIIPMPPT